MSRERAPGATRQNDAERQRRDQEVLRANKELAAYFRGRRTEREARAALKIIKAFVRERERLDAKSRPPLPGVRPAPAPKTTGDRKAASAGRRRRPAKPRRTAKGAATIEPAVAVEPASGMDGLQET